MAAGEPANREPRATQRTVALEGFERVGRAARVEAARRRPAAAQRPGRRAPAADRTRAGTSAPLTGSAVPSPATARACPRGREVAESTRPRRRSRDEIGARGQLELTGDGPEPPAQAVADDRGADATADGERDTAAPPPSERRRSTSAVTAHRPGPATTPARRRARKCADRAHGRLPWAPSSAGSVRHGTSGRQPAPALQPAGPQHSTACTGGHAMPKAVALGPLPVVGLVGPLHLGGASLEAVLELGGRLVDSG